MNTGQIINIIFILQEKKLRFGKVNCPKQQAVEHRFVWSVSWNTALNLEAYSSLAENRGTSFNTLAT